MGDAASGVPGHSQSGKRPDDLVLCLNAFWVVMKSDSEIERDVKAELEWDPDLDANNIAISVKRGVVTLAGFVKSYTDTYEAEAAAKRVAGVANDPEVRMSSVDERPDPDIAREAVAALKSQLPISSDNIKVIVKNGWVTLEGKIGWQYQRQTAESAVRRIKGVKGVSNTIRLQPHPEPIEIKRKIQEALRRSAEVDANRIQVETNGGEFLKGTVRSWIERAEAERASWAAPGVTTVDDRIVVSPSTRGRNECRNTSATNPERSTYEFPFAGPIPKSRGRAPRGLPVRTAASGGRSRIRRFRPQLDSVRVARGAPGVTHHDAEDRHIRDR
jgi:osmotically-inducible protein OsmY